MAQEDEAPARLSIKIGPNPRKLALHTSSFDKAF
jgi:hypothetical protein